MVQMAIVGGVYSVKHIKAPGIRCGSFFKEIQVNTTAVTLDDRLHEIALWAQECPVSDAISDATGIDISQWLCKVCSTKLLQAPIVLGAWCWCSGADQRIFVSA